MMNLSATHAVSVNPTTGEVVSSLPWASEREVDAAIALAAAGYRQWRQTPLADRADALRRIGAALRASGNNKSRAAKLLGVTVRNLYYKLQRYRISVPGEND